MVSQSSLLSQEMLPKLGLIAGGGDIPSQVIDHCLRVGRSIFAVGIEGHASPDLFKQGIPHIWCRLGALGKMLEALKQAQVGEIVLIGGIQRPSFFDLRPDFYTAKLLARLGVRALGDDALLTFLIQELEDQGFKVKGIEEVLPFKEVLLSAGALGAFSLPQDLLEDIHRGIEVARALGCVDVGQSLIIDQGLVLGVEALEGTDALIMRCGHIKKERFSSKNPSGLLIKFSKMHQEKRVDLPTIGIKTLQNLKQWGFLGVVAEAHKTLLVDSSSCEKYADENEIFVFGWEEKK